MVWFRNQKFRSFNFESTSTYYLGLAFMHIRYLLPLRTHPTSTQAFCMIRYIFQCLTSKQFPFGILYLYSHNMKWCKHRAHAHAHANITFRFFPVTDLRSQTIAFQKLFKFIKKTTFLILHIYSREQAL